MANIHVLKEYLIDRNCQGEKPELVVEWSYTDPETGLTEDRAYLAYNEPKNHQNILDMLKRQQLVTDDATIDDYDFLFEFRDAEAAARTA
jgi:hypothetical protein